MDINWVRVELRLRLKALILGAFLCIFESDTVKNDCPVQIFRKMINFI